VESLKRAFLWPSVAGVALMIALFATGVRHLYALLSFGLCLFVTWTVIGEFYKGSRAIAAKSGSNLFASMIELTHRNTRRYGGYIVHMGIVFMFIGFTGSAFNQDATVEVGTGSVQNIGHYQLRIADIQQGENDNYVWHRAVVNVSKGGQDLGSLQPERRLYKASKQPTSEVSIRRRLNEDLYLKFAGMSNDNTKAVIQAYVFPLVSWIWIGYWVVMVGTLVCLVPPKMRLQYARTEVVGIAGKHATIQK
jgi:cytochrome c-type biogenesis protein CcmF